MSKSQEDIMLQEDRHTIMVHMGVGKSGVIVVHMGNNTIINK